MNINRPLLLMAALLPGLAACTPIDVGFGDSTRLNAEVQTIDPAPVYDEALASVSGNKMAPAVERYRTDKVKQPRGIRTTRSISGSGSGSGGGTN